MKTQAASGESVASVMPSEKMQIRQHVKQKTPVQRPGHNCRAGNNCRAQAL
jgi:hypothetical protein